MTQIITNRNQTTISITQGDNHVFIQTHHDSPSLIQVNANGIHIQIQTGNSPRQTPVYDTFEELSPFPMTPLPKPVTAPSMPILPQLPTIKMPFLQQRPFKKSVKSVGDLNMPVTEFVSKALKWCEAHIEKSARIYTFEIRYYKAKKTLGKYELAKRNIVIYVDDTLSLKVLCEVIIHEYAHYLHIKSKADQQAYDQLSRTKGYWQNPHEKLSRAYEARFGSALLAYMISLHTR